MCCRSAPSQVTGFCCAKRVQPGQKTFTMCGTPYYLAPEMILHKGHDKARQSLPRDAAASIHCARCARCTQALDWWTFGVLMFEMLDGRPPFRGDNELEVYRKVSRLDYKCPYTFGNDLRDILRLLFQLVPVQRLGNLRNGASDVMAHPFFLGFNWDQLKSGQMQSPHVPPLKSPTDVAHTGPRRLHQDKARSPRATRRSVSRPSRANIGRISRRRR